MGVCLGVLHGGVVRSHMWGCGYESYMGMWLGVIHGGVVMSHTWGCG